MKRKRNEPSGLASKILCLQNGSSVEVQLEDGKWHSGVIVQCQPRKYLVQVEQEQYWIESDLIRPNAAPDQKRSVSFEYRPGQFLRNETKPSSTNRIVADEKTVSPPPPPPPPDSSQDSKKKRPNHLDQKKSPFVWKPSTTSTIQTRRSSKSNPSAGMVQEETHLTEAVSNSEKASEVLIFRPVIRFVESSTSPKRHCSTDDENLYITTASTDSRSSSTTSTENPFPLEVPLKSETKSACFLETPPPSLPDIHLAQESDAHVEKPHAQLKSKRKQDRPQRKPTEQELRKPPPPQESGDPGYLSDEYSEPNPASENLLTCAELENYAQYLDEDLEKNGASTEHFAEELARVLHNNPANYQRLEDYRRQAYPQSSARLTLVAQILQKLFCLFYQKNLEQFAVRMPEEIQTHVRLCLSQLEALPGTRKRSSTSKAKRLQNLKAKSKRSSLSHPPPDPLLPSEQHALLSPASPLTPLCTKPGEPAGPSNEDLLSPEQHLAPRNLIEQISTLPKERDVYEIIHCLCACQIDNGFMIQCETCLCWSHCECVGVTANCIPAFFKCSVCTKAEADRTSQWTFTSILDDETTALFLTSANNPEKVSLLLSYCKRLWNLREQMIELKLRSTPILRSLQYTLRSDDLHELYKSVNIPSDDLTAKIEERSSNREYYHTVGQTIDHLLDSVCSSLSTSSCPSLELSRGTPSSGTRVHEQMDLIITHLCDDEQTRQRRLTIQHRYEAMMAKVDEQIQAILREHQNLQTQLAFEFGIIPMDLSEEYLSYDTYEAALRSAIARLKC